MKKKLPKSWQPSERLYSLLGSKGIPREWIGHQIGEFKLYWLDAGLMKSSWDRTFNNWVKKNWEHVDKRRMYRERVPIKPYEEDLRQPDPRKNVETYTTDHTEPMTSEKRVEFADYLSRSMNNNCK